MINAVQREFVSRGGLRERAEAHGRVSSPGVLQLNASITLGPLLPASLAPMMLVSRKTQPGASLVSGPERAVLECYLLGTPRWNTVLIVEANQSKTRCPPLDCHLTRVLIYVFFFSNRQQSASNLRIRGISMANVVHTLPLLRRPFSCIFCCCCRQSRGMEVGGRRRGFTYMLNSKLSSATCTMSYILENYQTSAGVTVPEVSGA